MSQAPHPIALFAVVMLASAQARGSELPRVRDGDLVFHRSTSAQSELVRVATGSEITHVGVVFLEDGEPWVLEAVQTVRKTRLSSWVARGVGGKVIVRRLKDADAVLTGEVIAKMRRLGEGWLGKAYDGRFQWSDDRMYCSELVYKLYERAVGVRIGKIAKARDMNLTDPGVRKEIERRFGQVPFDPEEPVVTPKSMLDDSRLSRL